MRDITLNELGETLRKIRKEKGLTQHELAEKIQVGQSIISQWEQGTRNPGFMGIYKFCQFFGMTVDELLGVEKEEYVSLLISRNNLNELQTTLREFEDALTFIIPHQDTKLHYKWTELKRTIELLLLSAE